MSIVNFMFYFFIALAALSAVGILFTKNVFYGALLLIVCLLSVAGIYVLMHAEFIAVTQILIYVGGILVVIIFGIMLTTKISGKPLAVGNKNWFAALIVGGFFFVLLAKLFTQTTLSITQQKTTIADAIQQIGVLLLSDFILPFEVAGILLLITLVGAAITASNAKLKN
jgi:NADH:ubiquinone oxidoreductase subunit 6 (subunit J)